MNSTSDGSFGAGGRAAVVRVKWAAGAVPRISKSAGVPSDAGRVREAVAVGEVAAVALVADDAGVAAEHVAVVDVGAVEEPVVGAVDRVAAGAVGDPLADAVVAAPGEAHAGHVVLGPPDEVVGPDAGELGLPVGVVHRVLLERSPCSPTIVAAGPPSAVRSSRRTCQNDVLPRGRRRCRPGR